jgi:hypothetical protein
MYISFLLFTYNQSVADPIDLTFTPYMTSNSWFRHCATTWKIMGSIPDKVFGIF